MLSRAVCRMLILVLLGSWMSVSADMAASVPAQAATPAASMLTTPQFRRYGVPEGLPTGTMFAVAQDHHGVMWFAGPGLVRYDGVQFTVFPHTSDPASEPLNGVYSLYVDRDDRIWMGGVGNGLAVYDQASGRFQHWRHDDKNPASLVDDEVWSITRSANGELWIATTHGLDRMRLDQQSFEHVPLDGAGDHAKAFPMVRALMSGADGSLWIGASSGLYRRFPDGRLQRVPVDPAFRGSPGKARRIEQGDGEIRIVLNGGLLIVGRDGVARPFAEAQLASLNITSSVRDAQGRLWLSSADGARLGTPNGHLQKISAEPLLPGGLPDEQIWQIFRDREGGLWFAFEQGHLGYLPPAWNDFVRYTHIPDDPDSLAQTGVITVATSRDGQIWVGGFAGWVDKLDITTGKAAHVLRDLGGMITSMAEDARGRLWVIAADVVYVYDHGKQRRLDLDKVGAPRPISVNVDDDKRVYLLSWREGVFVIDPDDFSIRRVQGRSGDTLVPDQLHFHDGSLWYANGSGLFRLDETAQRLVAVSGVPLRPVDTIAFGGTDFWLDSGGTLERYRYMAGHAELLDSIDMRQQSLGVNINALRVDSLGHLWLVGDVGLWRLDTQTREFQSFGAAQGLSNTEFGNGSTTMLPDGTIFVASVGGVFAFHPQQFLAPATAPAQPLVRLSSLRLRKSGAVQPIALDAQPVQLGWHDRDLLVNARLSSYIDPAANHFRFRLTGFDTSWVDVDSRGEREFAGLPAGNYSLQVMGAGADNVWGNLDEPLLIHVEAAPWARWWAWLIYALIAGLLAWLVLRASRRRLATRHHLQLTEQRQRMAEQASAAKTQFLATMSHEIRTPMTGVMGMAELLLTTPLTPQQRDYTEAMQRSGGMLLKLLNDALDLARIEAGRLELELAPFDPRVLIEDVAQLERGQAQLKGLRLDVRIADDLPPRLLGDAVRIKQIMLNLANNALKFTERGSVTLDASWRGDGLLLSISDTGPGIPEASQTRLFQRFEQEQGPQRSAGSGLGLAICRELVALMNGSIELVSRMSLGSTFHVRLPLPTVDATPLAAPVAAETRPDHALHLLLVEDDSIVAAVIGGLLEQQGHRIVHVANGLNAMAELAQGGFDAVLLDLDLPGLDGFQIARLIRQREGAGPRVPILAVTARSGGDEGVRTREAGMDDFLRKPVSGEQLARALASLDRYRVSGDELAH